MTFENIYLYHLDEEVQKIFIYKNSYDKAKIEKSFFAITKIAFLLCEKCLFVPFSNYLESKVAFDILNYFRTIPTELNPLVLLSTAPNVEAALNKKQREHEGNYHNQRYQYQYFTENGIELPGIFRQRSRSASNDIEEEFLNSIGSELWIPFKRIMDKGKTDSQKDIILEEVPKYLEGKAYISDYITPFLIPEKENNEFDNANRILNILITQWYLQSYLSELDAVCLKDIPYIDADIILPDAKKEYYPSYRNIVTKMNIKRMRDESLFEFVQNCTADELLHLKYSPQWKTVFDTEDNKKYWKGFDMKEKNVTYGIITALPEEYTAMKVLLDNTITDNDSNSNSVAGSNFLLGDIKGNNGTTTRIALALLPGAGEEDAAIYAQKMQNKYDSIEMIFMIGIAGGVPSKTHLGDVVISTQGVIQVDYGKNTSEGFKTRINNDMTSVPGKEKVRLLKSEYMQSGLDFDTLIDRINEKCKNADFHKPKVTTEEFEEFDADQGKYIVKSREVSAVINVIEGRVGTANSVLKDPEKRDELAGKYEITAFEMEAGGINRASAFEQNGFLTIRGITDFCDNCKNDVWHNYAAAVAASFTYILIGTMIPC